MRKNYKIRKAIVTIFTAVFLLTNTASVYALEIPTAPTPPTAPSAPSAPTAPTPPPAPSAPPAPTAPTQPTPTSAPLPTPTIAVSPTVSPNPTGTQNENAGSGQSQEDSSNQNSSLPTPTPTTTQGAETQGASGVQTGDASNDTTLITTANNNSAVAGSGSSGGAYVANIDNGAGSTNNASAQVANNGNTIQNNSATVTSNLNQETITGQNSSSFNTGDNSFVQTGNANTTGTIITAVNTNVDGVAVSEFNIADDHLGDIILDFGSNCVQGCTGQSSVTNTGNGTNSNNNANVDTSDSDVSFQNNDATVENNLTLLADSGNNQTSYNTGGDNLIDTGDANVAANVLTFANNNIVGNVIYGVVNIFGNLVGDIILPDGFLAGCCGLGTDVANSDNGAGSSNIANSSNNTTDSTYQFNNADIENNLIFDAQTGDNSLVQNTNGDNYLSTGNANIEAQVINVANTNIDGGNWWLVIINEAGNWIGKIMGSPDGSTLAGSEGFEFQIGENGEVNATNSGNGAGSANTANYNQSSDTTTVQSNDANIVNNVNLTANTGNNSANANTGGTSGILTGDANIIANIVNFVNNNIVGDGKLIVTVVNVFGSWIGDFVTPGNAKSESTADTYNENENKAVGGTNMNGNEFNYSGSDDVISVSQSRDQNTESNTAVAATVYNTIGSADRLNKQVAGVAITSTPDNESISMVGSESITNQSETKKTLNINLAWALFAIPALILITFIKKSKLIVIKTR